MDPKTLSTDPFEVNGEEKNLKTRILSGEYIYDFKIQDVYWVECTSLTLLRKSPEDVEGVFIGQQKVILS